MAAGLFKLIARLLLEVLLWTQLSSWGWAVAPLGKSSKWPRRARDNSLPWKSCGKIRDLAEKIIPLHEKIIYLHRPRPTYLYCWKNASKYSKLQLMPTLEQLLPASHGEQSPQPNGPPTPNNFLFYFFKEILFDGEPVKPSTSSHDFGDVGLWYIYISICISLFFWKKQRPSWMTFPQKCLGATPSTKNLRRKNAITQGLLGAIWCVMRWRSVICCHISDIPSLCLFSTTKNVRSDEERRPPFLEDLEDLLEFSPPQNGGRLRIVG